MKTTEEKPYYTPYLETGRQMVGQIVQEALSRSGLSTRKFCEAVCGRANNSKALDKTTLSRLIKAGQKNGSKGGDFWRLRYIAPFTWREDQGRPFTEEELIAIAMGELKLVAKDIESESVMQREERQMSELIPFSRAELYRLRAVIIASADADGFRDSKRWIEKKGLPLIDFIELIVANGQQEGGKEPQNLLEQLLPHLYQVESWTGKGDGVTAIVNYRRYLSLGELLKAVKNGNGVFV